tara:strand:- start:36 stop:395 length:360 start_codon:yes stop_codon:yes gene_type:complete
VKDKELKKIVVDALEDLKGESISCLEVGHLTSVTEYMVIATGRSTTHIKSLADNVVKKVKELNIKVIGVEGRSQSEWVLVDIGGVVVHIMLSSIRLLYDLEELWSFEKPIVPDQEPHLS